jgi:sugar phosphate isomerase/epimerase
MAARILFSTGSLYVLDTSYCFELAAEAGFDGIEIMCDERWSTRDPGYLKRLSDRYNLPVLVAHTPFSRGTPGWAQPDNELRRIDYTLDLALELKAQVIVVHLPRKRGAITISAGRRTWRIPWRSVESPVKRWIENDLAGVQARTKVKIALENMPVSQVAGRNVDPIWWNSVESWSQVHRWLTLDTTHWGTMRVDPLEAYRAAGERVCHIHLSNYDGRQHRLPHKGSLNLKTLLRALSAAGYDGTLSLELSPGALMFKEAAVMRRNLRDSLKFCRDHLA